MEHTFGLDWDEIPSAVTSTAMLRESGLIVFASDDDEEEDALAGATYEKVGNEWVLYAANGREVARSKDKALLEDYRNNRTSALTDMAQSVVDTFRLDTIGVTAESLIEQAGLSAEAAKPKGNRAPDEPTQQPMRPTNQIRQSPSADQIKARKQMARKQASGEPSNWCEQHDQPGHCTEECVRFTQSMHEPAYDPPRYYEGPNGPSVIDWSGTHRRDDEDEDRPAFALDPARKAVIKVSGSRKQAAFYVRWPDGSEEGPYDTEAEALEQQKITDSDDVEIINKESAMRTEAQILTEMATASLADQRLLAIELDTVRKQRTASVAADREVDLADTIVRAHLTPVRVHAMHTVATDWVDTEEPAGDPTLAMKTEATLWFQRTSAEVREDADEFATQATGMATRLASQHGDQADAAFEAFIGHVEHLYSQAAKVAVEAPDPSGQAVSKLPEPDDEDPFLSEDWDGDKDTGVHPEMPGATGAKEANIDNLGDAKAPPFGSKDGGDDEDEGKDYDSDPDDPHYGENAKADRQSDKEAAKTAADSKADDSGQGVSSLPEPDDTEPYLADDWKSKSDDPETGKDAADVKDVPTPGKNGYPKASMLDKAASFRALVQSNLER